MAEFSGFTFCLYKDKSIGRSFRVSAYSRDRLICVEIL